MSRTWRSLLCTSQARDLARTETEQRQKLVALRVRCLRAFRLAIATLIVSTVLASTAHRPEAPQPSLDPISHLSVGDHPLALAATASDVWAVGPLGVLERISARTQAVVATVRLGHSLSDVAIYRGTVYVAAIDGTVIALSAHDSSRRRAVQVEAEQTEALRLAVDEEGVWIAGSDSGRLTLLTHHTLRPLADRQFHHGIADITTGDHGTWIALPDDNEVARIAPAGSGIEVTRRIRSYPSPTKLAASGPRVWVASSGPAVLWAFNAISGSLIDSIHAETPPSPAALTAGAGALWLVAGDPPAVYEFDGGSGQAIDGPLKLGSMLFDVASTGDAVWAADYGRTRVGRLSIPRRATQRVAEVQQAGPPEQLGIARGTYVLLDAGLIVAIAILAAVLWLTQLSVPREEVPEHPVLWMVDRRLAAELAGPMPEESTHMRSRRGLRRRGFAGTRAVPFTADHEVESAHGRSDVYRGVTDGERVSEILKRTNARESLYHGYGELPTEQLPPKWTVGDDSALVMAMRQRHELFATRLVYVRADWHVSYEEYAVQRWTLPELRRSLEPQRVPVPPEAQPVMLVRPEHVLDRSFAPRSSHSNLDVLALVERTRPDGQLQLRPVAIFLPVCDDRPHPLANPLRQRAGRIRRDRGGLRL
jgi:hypothetical protein